jgi:hypothetical protein
MTTLPQSQQGCALPHGRTRAMRTQHRTRPPVVIRAGDLDAYTAPDFTTQLRPQTWTEPGPW